MEPKRVDIKTAERRLESFSNLANVLGKNWLEYEYKKDVKQRSLITGWLLPDTGIPFEDSWPWHWLKDLEGALAYLESNTQIHVWRKIVRKIRAHTDRATFKGTLAELSLCMFLGIKKIMFDLDVKLQTASGKDVDIKAYLNTKSALNIEVQWVSPSDISEEGAYLSSLYEESYPIDFEYEMQRVKKKIFDKIPKFTHEDITFVAINCTSSPELGGKGFSLIKEILIRSFNEKNDDDRQKEVNTAIRNYIDGVIWFEIEPDVRLLPHNRAHALNPKSAFRENETVLDFLTHWKNG